MRTIYLLICGLLMCATGQAQLLVMDFENDSTSATTGPDASSISSSAGTGSGGSNGNGLSARYNSSRSKKDIDLDFANTGGYWDVAGIDLSIDFQREESTGSFFTRLSNQFDFGMTGGNLRVKYQVDNGSGGATTVNSGNIQSIPNDDTFRNYRFTYDPSTGIGRVMVDGDTVWSNDGPDNRDMYWSGAGAMRIGDNMDASGSTEVIFDGVVASAFTTLPVELTHFDAHRVGEHIQLSWQTATEINNDYFDIERSFDLEAWDFVFSVQGAGNSTGPIEYFEYDYDAPKEDVFYRLRQVDFNGAQEYSNTVFVPYTASLDEKTEVLFQTFPNPVERGNRLNLLIENLDGNDLLLVLRDMNGKEMFVKTVYIAQDKQYEVVDVSQTIPAGHYIITATSDDRVYNNHLMIR